MAETPRAETETISDDLVPEDDRVIGRAFRWSLLAFALLGAAGYGVWRWLQPAAPEPPKRAAKVEAPVAQEKAVAAPDLHFTDVTAASGIDFRHETGGYGEKLLPETMGPGCAFVDVNGDGAMDVVLVNGTWWPEHKPEGASDPTPALYVNDGHGHFEDATKAWGLDVSFYGMGVAVGDADGDGRPDLFFTGVGGNHLFLNQGARFRDATAEAGLVGDADGWTTSAGFFDYDRDGDLDLFVCTYVAWSRELDRQIGYTLDGKHRAFGPPTNYPGTFCRLYRNDGHGHFTDVSKAAGLQVLNPDTHVPVAKALGVCFLDPSGSGYPDVFVANDTTANFLFKNRRDGTFEEVGVPAGVAYDSNGKSTGAMGVDAADFRNDGTQAVAVGNFANEPTSFYVAARDPRQFTDQGAAEGLYGPSRLALKFGVLFLDVDLDGRLDFFETNGHIEQEIEKVQRGQHYRQPSQLFWNLGPGARAAYAEVPHEKLGDLAKPVVGRGAAYADIDGDGDLDLLVTQCGDVPLLLRNDQALGHHWLRVRLKGPAGNPDGYGALLTLRSGGLVQRRSLWTTRSYLSQVEPVATFGLGDAAKVEALEVLWPDGTRQPVPVDAVDRVLLVQHP